MGVKPVASVDDPLYAHGCVLLGGELPVVLVSVDWCGIGNEAHDLWRSKLADAAGTKPERVLVCAIHQHDAPLADLEAERLIAKLKLDRSTLDLDWHAKTLARVADTLKRGLKDAKPVSHIGTGEAKVEKIASNRRIIGKDGKIELWRGSAMTDPKAKEAPEGLIDPWLKTISFWNGEMAIASLSVYATHPMSFYGKGNVSADFVGLARRLRQRDEPGVMHFFANGCGGNLAPGKYNRGEPEDREELTERLYKAWKAAWKNTKKLDIEQVSFRSVPYTLEPKTTEMFATDKLEAILNSDKTRFDERVRAAYALSWRKRCAAKHQLDLPVLDFGGAVIALLPGEPFIEYQLAAQKLRPESFVITLGYGDYGPVYIPTDAAFAEGGYELGDWSFVTTGVEKALTAAIRQGLVADAFQMEGQLRIADAGKSPFVIVTPVTPTAEESTAAKLLSDTLENVTGARIPVRSADAKDLPRSQIRIGQSSALAPEEWAIRTTADTLLIAGGRPRGLFYGVCEFLETNVGVYRFDPFASVVPKTPNLSLPAINRSGKPAFEVRTLFTGFPYGHPATSPENVRLFHVWNKNNLYGSLGEGDVARHVPDGVHTFGKFISAKEFAKDHPEYFSMDADGKRMTDDKGSDVLWIQLCVTNDEVRRITVERAKKALRYDAAEARKDGRAPTRYLVLSQNDNTTDLCLCPKCKAVSEREGSQAGLLLEYVNVVARGLRDEFPDVRVLTDAYNYTLQPPKSIRPEPNVVVRYIDNYGFSDPTRPLTDPLNRRPKAIFDGWAKTAPTTAVWDYWRVFPLHAPGLFAPSVNTPAIRSDLQLFHRNGVRYVTVECEDFLGAGFDPHPQSFDLQSFMTLQTWVGMKLLDDPNREPRLLIATFCRGYFGPASEPMHKLHDWIAERQAKTPIRIVDVQRHIWLKHLCDAEFFATAYRHLDDAVRLAKGDRAILTRLARERLVVDSAYLWTHESVKRYDPNTAAKLPERNVVVKRHRQDWQRYLAATFDAEGIKQATPIVERGLRVIERAKGEDSDWVSEAVSAKEGEIVLDGKLDDPTWKAARMHRLVPMGIEAANDDTTAIRYAWTPDALYLSVEQPREHASAGIEVSLTDMARSGFQLSLYCNRDGSAGPTFYRQGKDGGLEAVKGRTSGSRMKLSGDDKQMRMEIRVPWSDLDVKPAANGEFFLNVATYPKPISRVPSHVSSPWLVADTPAWNPAYFGLLRLTATEPSLRK
ncbi:MAG: DUF4838 domain-containing protein [Gemmataceae bacterium]